MVVIVAVIVMLWESSAIKVGLGSFQTLLILSPSTFHYWPFFPFFIFIFIFILFSFQYYLIFFYKLFLPL